MKLILAVSNDGFLARGERDDMSWTGPTDKAVFKLLTLFEPETILIGRVTADQMPLLPGRRVVSLSRSGTTLWQAAERLPNAWLAGGPTLALEALRMGLIDRAVICRVPVDLGHGIPFGPLEAWLPTRRASVSKFYCPKVGDVSVELYSKWQKWPGK